MQTARRIPVWSILTGVFVLIVTGLGLIVWDVYRRADLVLQRHDEDLTRRRAEIDRRPDARAPLEEPWVDGDARDFYAQAVAGLGVLTASDEEALPSLQEEEEVSPDDDRIAEIHQRLRPALDRLRQGARTRRASRLFEWAGNDPDYAGPMKLAKVLADLFGHLHRTGRAAEAGDLLVLGLFYSQDLRRNGLLVDALVANVQQCVLLGCARGVLVEHAFDAPVLRRLAGQVDRCLAEAADWAAVLEAEDVWMRSRLLQSLDLPSNPLMQPSWRHLYSRKIHIAQLLAGHERAMESIRPVLSSSWTDQLRAAEALDPRPEGRRLDLEFGSPQLGRYFRLEGARRLNLLLMRTTLALALYEVEKGGPAPALEALVPGYLSRLPACPLTGTAFMYAEGRVWSVGADGTDQGGVWDPSDPADPLESRSPDIVWKAGRK